MEARIAEACARLDAILARERADLRIDPRNVTTWRLGERVAPLAVVLIHGFTNGPLQYAALAPQLAERGHAVIVPRIRYHGFRDRLTPAIAALRAEDWEAGALEAIEIAARCGERVAVLGISVAATLCGWLASRVALDRAVAVAPFCGVRGLPGRTNDAFAALLRALPNRFVWWDPRRRAAQLPLHAYPRFSTRALGETLRLSTGLVAPRAAARARAVTLVLNRADPIVDNAFARRRFEELRACGVALDVLEIAGPPMHDVIEPSIPGARPALVYPGLIAALER
jgi:alpha-beta hydrolase superfamily lysophospholipase